MNKVKTCIRRFSMSVLFIMALLMTFHSISGIKVQTLLSFANQKFESSIQSPIQQKIELALKEMKRVLGIWTVNASAEEQPSLEESVDWTKYPKQTVIATGYTAGYESTGKDEDNPEYGITYSGVKVKRDLYSTIAADLNVFPIGTILFIPGYGYGVVADKGGAICGNRLDLYYETVRDVYERWGKRELDVYIVEKGTGTLSEQQLNTLNENESMQVFRQKYIKSERR